jgi:hypothetical protein
MAYQENLSPAKEGSGKEILYLSTPVLCSLLIYYNLSLIKPGTWESSPTR